MDSEVRMSNNSNLVIIELKRLDLDHLLEDLITIDYYDYDYLCCYEDAD